MDLSNVAGKTTFSGAERFQKGFEDCEMEAPA